VEEESMKQFSIQLVLAAFLGILALGSNAFAQGGNDRLALKGYDLVAYFTEKRPVLGNALHQYEWDGAVYRFVSAEHLELFKVDPDRYLPQYNNWCAASVAKGEKVHGNPEWWLVMDGRLYLFGKPVGPGLMSKGSTAMRSQADENWSKVSQLATPPVPDYMRKAEEHR
jgi:YHS domain-containing protein